MTVPAIATNEVQYVEDGSTGPFSYPYRLLAASDLEVRRRLTGADDFELLIGWSVSGTDVTLSAGVAGAVLSIRRKTAIQQPTAYPPYKDFPAESHELALDRQTLALQDAAFLAAQTAQRSLMAPEGEALGALPSAANRAGKFFGADAEGNLIALGGTGNDPALRTDLAGTQGGRLVGFMQTGLAASLRSQLAKSREFISPADFGVIGDGVADDTVAFQRLVDFVNSLPNGARVHLPYGDIRLVGTTFTFTKPVSFIGHGQVSSSITFYSNARIVCQGTRTALYGVTLLNTAFNFDKLALLTDGVHTSGPLKVTYSPHPDAGAASLGATLTMRDVVIAGRNSISGFALGLELVDLPWPKISNVAFIGDYGNATRMSGYGIKYTGQDGSATFHQVRGYYLADGIWAEGEMEGDIVNDCEFVSCQRGLTAKDTTNGLQPLLDILYSHFNCEEYGVALTGIDQFTITGNVFYAQGARGLAAVATMVDITPTTAPGADNGLICSGQIFGNTFDGDGAFAASTLGIRIRGVAVAVEKYRIFGNQYQGLTLGRQLDAGTNGVQIDEATEQLINCTTYLTDLGAGNLRQPKIIAGTSIGTTDGNGQFAVSYGISSQFSGTPFPVVGPGDAASETFAPIAASCSTVGFEVQVYKADGTAAGAGLTRRVNWIAGSN